MFIGGNATSTTTFSLLRGTFKYFFLYPFEVKPSYVLSQ